MKKILFSLIALMAVMTVQAQSICGSWQVMQPQVNTHDDGSFETLSYIYTFNEDGTFSIVADVTESTKPSQTKEREVALAMKMKGTYTLEGDKLVMKNDANALDINVISISENGKVVNSPEILSAMNTAFNSKEAKAKVASKFKSATYTVKVNGSMLEVVDANGKAEQLMKIATIKN